MGTRGPVPGYKRLEMTPERIATFLKVLRSSGGVWSAACQAASPHSDGPRRCYTSFKQLRLRDREFDQACAEIIELCADDLEREIIRRGKEGWETPVYQKGEQVFNADGSPAVVVRYSDALLLAAARAARPEKFGEKKDISITHHKAPGGYWEITAEDTRTLSQEHKRMLGVLIAAVQENRGNTLALMHQPGKVLDVPVVDVEPVAVEVVNEGDFVAEDFPAWGDD